MVHNKDITTPNTVILENTKAALGPTSKKRSADKMDVRERNKKPSTELDPAINDDLHIHAWNRLMLRIKQKKKKRIVRTLGT